MLKNRKDYDKAYYKARKEKTKRVNLTLSNSEYKAFKELANNESLPVASLIKKLASAYKNNLKYVSADKDSELKELIFLIRNIANNLNQLAFSNNALGQMVDKFEVLAHIQQLEQAIKDFIVKGSNK